MLFDGTCAMCNGAVRWTLRYDKKRDVFFAPLQSPIGEKVLKTFSIPPKTDSLIVIEKGVAFLYSDAVIRLLDSFPYPYRLLRITRWIPRPLRHFFYRIVARYRYRLFGKQKRCILYPPSIQRRFLYEADALIPFMTP